MAYPKTTISPWDHQVEAWEMLKDNISKKRYGLYIAHDMGCGKTKLTVDCVVGYKSKRTLVLCPDKAIRTWKEHVENSCMENLRLIIPKYSDLPKSKRNSTKACADYIQNELQIAESLDQNAFVVTNYEKSWRRPMGPKLGGKNESNPFKVVVPGVLDSWKWNVLIFDEAHRIKAHNSKVGWQAFRLARKAFIKLFLSGTPFPQGPMDVFGQFRAMNPQVFGISFVRFRGTYAILNPYMDVPVISEYQRLDEMYDKIKPWMHKVAADDVLELPDRVDRDIVVDLSDKAMKVFKELEKEMITVIEAEVKKGLPVEVIAKNHAAKFIKLQQVSAGVVTWTEGEGEEKKKFEEQIDFTKAEAIKEFIEDLDPKEEPVVVFCYFTPERKLLYDVLSKIPDRKIAQIAGGIDELEDFKHGDCNIALVQIDAGGEAIDLTKARYVIYSSTGVKTGKYRQSRRRVRRPGQKRKCFYYHVIADKTWDRRIIKGMKEKGEVVDFLIGGIVDFLKTGKRPETSLISDLEFERIYQKGNQNG